MSISNLRRVFPALCETWAYSCAGNVNKFSIGCLGKKWLDVGDNVRTCVDWVANKQDFEDGVYPAPVQDGW